MNVSTAAERPRLHNGRPSLFLNSLQRIYSAGDAVDGNPRRRSPDALQIPDSVSPSGTMIDLVESLFVVTEFDPLPLVNRRDDSPTSSGVPSGADGEDRDFRDDAGVALVSPYGGKDRLSPERIARVLLAATGRGRLIDVSMSGVALHLADALPSGTRIAIRLASRTPGKHVDAAATVLRCRQHGEAGWNVVCRFDKNLTFEQIHLVGQDLFASTIV